MLSRARVALPLSILATVPLALAGCAPVSDDGADVTLRIVASTNVYGDIAATIAGDAAQVTSIIHDAAQDPHEYEATPRDALAIADADMVIVNGGGYDEFMHTLLEAHDNDAVVLDAVELSGLETDDHEADSGDATGEQDHHAHGEFNEHVWYSLDAMTALAGELAARLGELDPADASTFTANAQDFVAGLGELEHEVSRIAESHDHAHVAITEPVPLYLLEAAGLENVTPEEFSVSVEEGTDVPALVLQDVLALVADGSVAFLAYNDQTVGPQTEQVLAAARDAGTPVVSFTELLPEGDGYLEWMRANIDAIAAALGS
ncbi:MAG: metal ABC transporter solute-binding protein, Zn/Mn family [Protaetiibacter sp.]